MASRRDSGGSGAPTANARAPDYTASVTPRGAGSAAGGIATHAMAVAPALLAAVWIFRHALGTFFTPDDLVSLARAAGLEPSSPAFRPLSAGLAFRVQWAFFRLDPRGYHAVNLALHLAAVIGVYALAVRLSGRVSVAAGSALLFAASAIAFTPLHWLSGIGDLLACGLLLAATLAHLEGRRRGQAAWCWVGAGLAGAAALAKETAIAWPLALAVLEWRGNLGARRGRALLPGVLMGLAVAGWLALTRRLPGSGAADPYAVSASPVHLAVNLLTYLSWCVPLPNPLPDAVAGANPSTWPLGALVVLGVAAAIRQQRRRPRHPLEAGVAWWCAFLIPVLPLAHHTYLYYLYIPWAGGALALAAAVDELLGRLPQRAAAGIGGAALAAFLLVEGDNVAVRERLRLRALPLDRTLREATLLAHALPALREAGLPRGTPVGFVNPIPGPPVDLARSGPARAADRDSLAGYLPLEAVLRGGEALRLFAPGLDYRGFAATIPPGWENVECFLYEQRGWLRPWGRGQRALLNQAAMQAAYGRWAAAESSYARARAAGDTLPQALCGQVVALYRLRRSREADALADSFALRWPGDRRVPELRRARDETTVDPDLVPPFDFRIAKGPGARRAP